MRSNSVASLPLPVSDGASTPTPHYAGTSTTPYDSSLVNPPANNASQEQQAIPDLSFLSEKQRTELRFLLQSVASGTTIQLAYAVPNCADRDKIITWIGGNYETMKDVRKPRTVRLRAAYRLGTIYFYLRENPRFVNTYEQADAMGCPRVRVFHEKRIAFRICEVFKILGNAAFDKWSVEVEDFDTWPEHYYQAVFGCVRGVKERICDASLI
jgi:hypothetical protein